MLQWPFGSAPVPERAPQGQADLAPPPLVGREDELRLLRKALKTITSPDFSRAAAAAHAIFVAGSAGVGKTRLLRELADEAARQGVAVLWGGAYESGLLPPYLPFTEALRPYLRSRSNDELRQLLGLSSEGKALPNLGLQCLARLFPQIAALLDPVSLQDLLTPEQEKFGLLDGMATLLERITTSPAPAGGVAGATPPGQPLLLCLDDLQWADSASLELVLYLTTRLRSARLLLLGAFRSDALAATLPNPQGQTGAGSALARAIAELNRQRLFTLLLLGPLSEGA